MLAGPPKRQRLAWSSTARGSGSADVGIGGPVLGSRGLPSGVRALARGSVTPAILGGKAGTTLSTLTVASHPRRRLDCRTPRPACSAADLEASCPDPGPAAGGEGGTLCALIESRSREIGVAAIHRRSMEFEVSQFGDRGSYGRTVAMVLALHPAAVVVSRTARGTPLLEALDDALREAALPEPHFADRGHFDEAFGQGLLEDAHVEGLASSEFAAKFVACAALSALWRFIEGAMDLKLLPSAVRVTFRSISDLMVIDSSAARLLELTPSSRRRGQPSLLGLFSCRTPGGLRLLRQSLLQPLASKSEIELRQDAVEALLDNEALFYELQRILPAIGDVDLLAARLTSEPKSRGSQWCRAAVRTALKLRSALAALPVLAEALRGTDTAAHRSALLAEAHTVLSHTSFAELLGSLDGVLDGDGPQALGQAGSLAHVALMYAVRPNVSPLLDIARQTWNDALEQIHMLHRGYAEKHPELRIKLEYAERRGWYLSHAVQDRPKDFLHTASKGSSGRQMSTTRELGSENFKLRQAEREILAQTVAVLSNLYDVLRAEAALLYRVSHIASALDLVQAFAGYTLLLGVRTRPQLTDDAAAPIAIKGGRHPLLERMAVAEAGAAPFEPLDYCLSETCHFQAVTGTNGGGKSTYLLTLAQLIVLAQAGCFIPAESAAIRIVSSLFTRMGNSDSDSVEANASTFLVEAQETAHLLRGVLPDSLVLVDELGRGAAHSDSVAICWAVCEELLELKVYTLFATHLYEICSMQAVSPGFRNMHLQAAPLGDAGAAEGRHFAIRHTTCLKSLHTKLFARYGLLAARSVGMPAALLDSAGRIADAVTERLSMRLPVAGGAAQPPRPPSSADRGDDEGAAAEEAEVVARELLALACRSTAPPSTLFEVLRHLQAPWLDL